MTATNAYSDIPGDRHQYRLLADYKPFAGVPDEVLSPSGDIRPVWSQLLHYLENLEPTEMSRRFARADQYLRDAGVFFRQSGDDEFTARRWPLGHVPVLVAEAEWQTICRGLIQRAGLLEEIVRDIYGPNKLAADGLLPAELIGQSDQWLRPLVGVTQASGHFLHFIAFEIGRGPDGQWWVLGNRTQAPEGAGFALENRVANTRSYSELLRRMHVHRLAGFFRSFRDALFDLRLEGGSRIAMLTPGSQSASYYEQAYLGQYLGMLLVEGEDLIVENGRVMVRTVSGLQPVSVLWRRLEAIATDPLEFEHPAHAGTPGLVSAIRAGKASMVNALGSGILDMRALMAFIPRIAETFLSEPLAMPNIATWWCGEQAARDYVKANAGKMMIGSALSTHLPLDMDGETALRGVFPAEPGRTVHDWLDSKGDSLVGQELVTLSTTPAFDNGRLVPRPLSLRIFLARTPGGWTVMPGGFARIGNSEDATAIAMRDGGSSADVWIVSDKPVPIDTMLPSGSKPHTRRQPAMLPSRSAENLFWLGRYIERAEGLMRIIRSYHVRLVEAPDPASQLLDSLREHLSGYSVDAGEGLPAGLQQAIAAAVNSASKIRYRFAIDGWAALSDLANTIEKMRETVQPGDDSADAMGVLLRKITGFSGLVHENMYRFTGWRFMTIGRSIERAAMMADLMARFSDRDAPDGSYDLALELGDSIMSHRRRYSVTTTPDSVIDMLVLDIQNPRSILYHLNQIREQVEELPNARLEGQLSDLVRDVVRLETSLSIKRPADIDSDGLLAIAGDIAGLYTQLAASYLK